MSVSLAQHQRWAESRQRIEEASRLCPCCGQRLATTAKFSALYHVRTTPGQRAILLAMASAFPKDVPYHQLAKAMWTSRGKSRPAGDWRCMKVQISQLNKKIEPLGYKIVSAYTGEPGARRLAELKVPYRKQLGGRPAVEEVALEVAQ